jgi:hypothetical protein
MGVSTHSRERGCLTRCGRTAGSGPPTRLSTPRLLALSGKTTAAGVAAAGRLSRSMAHTSMPSSLERSRSSDVPHTGSEASRGPLCAGRGARASATRAATAEFTPSAPSARCRVPTRASLRAWRCATARAVADRIALGDRRGRSPAARLAIAFACRRRFAFSFRRVDFASALGALPTPAAAEAAGAGGPRACATAGWAGVCARREFA